ncbi:MULTISPECIES: ArgS-related anticodon-binding protein NrtL [Streptomyces]|uniref:ArgS-related anticodon-binding protein NrtL n=1 Tax=Streptomyces TaxID=1883 RepID=UPI00103EE23F|nr:MULTISPECIES: DALR anticodon-binding domain-containing protein [Streptomyces]MBT3075611.1 arginine--tRNA ligase [Streptomyces sp. COG21]MBT3079876.1 arginine--tRNA ligase [Streptomyces sp. COG20]MBT3089186.1 arginine--tRNA ligase [Streptomyces sp. CYG21]MBT3100997.1 arginine--tRNA ligase [Streptomyces sp. CBG30]MBT3106251.1 arginine--tRNA ligase [Streptomyces sp. COG19]
MTPADLSRTVLHAVRRAVDEDVLRAPVPARVRVERTRPGGSGDYACAVALQLAGEAGLPALEVARILRERVAAEPGIGRVEVTGPGFLSFTLDAPADRDRAVLDAVRERGLAYGHGDALRGETLRLHHAREVRAAVTADAVRRLLTAQGARVRVGCEGAGAEDAWARLGVRPDAYGPGAPEDAVIRPVPAGAGGAELLARLGPDAARWGLLRSAAHDRAPLGPDLLVQGEANPLFRVRYAYARTRALTRNAAALGFTAEPEGALPAGPPAGRGPAPYAESAAAGAEPPAHGGPEPAPSVGTAPYAEPAPHAGPAPYDESPARALLDFLADHPGVLLAAARHRAPDRVARQLEAVAHALFDFHDSCPPLPMGDEKPSAAHRSRLALAEAAGTVLAGGLSLLGISAPAHL